MEQSDLLVRRIKDGTVIDHINEGKGLNVLEALEIDGSSGNVITIALNMPSGKLKKKDMIKVEGRFLERDDTNKVSSDCPIIYGEYNQRLQTCRKKKSFTTKSD